MHWEVLIVPLIALGVWVLGTLFKTDDDPRARPGQRRQGFGQGPTRRPVSDLDRFLAEARRKRETGERPRPAPQPTQAATPPRPARSSTDAPLAQRVRPPTVPPPQRQPAPTPPPQRRRPEPTVPVARPAPAPQPEPPTVEPIVAVVVEPTPVVPERKPVAAKPAVAPALAQVLAMLRSPGVARTAFVLREVLDPPLCRRPHRFGPA